MHYMPNHYVDALSGTTIPIASGEGPSVPLTWQAADAWVPRQEPARDIADPMLQISPRHGLVSEAPSTYERCLHSDPSDIYDRCRDSKSCRHLREMSWLRSSKHLWEMDYLRELPLLHVFTENASTHSIQMLFFFPALIEIKFAFL